MDTRLRPQRQRPTTTRSAAARTAAAVALGTCLVGAVPLAPAQADVERELEEVYEQTAYGDFVLVGNGSMRCPEAGDERVDVLDGNAIDTCPAVQAGEREGQNNSYDMQWADVDDDEATFNSSTAEVAVPPGASVDHAWLSWSGITGRLRSAGDVELVGCDEDQTRGGGLDLEQDLPGGTARGTPVRVSIDGAAAQEYAPGDGYTEDSEDSLLEDDAQYYSGRADVTRQVAAALEEDPAAQVTVANIWTPEGFGCHAGWSLAVVWSFPEAEEQYAPTPRTVEVYDGHVRVSHESTSTTTRISDLSLADSSVVRVGVTAHEGDRDLTGDTFEVDEVGQMEPPGSTTGDNFFTSRADGVEGAGRLNNFSVDAKTFESTAIPTDSTSAELRFTTRGDGYLAQGLVVSAPTSRPIGVVLPETGGAAPAPPPATRPTAAPTGGTTPATPTGGTTPTTTPTGGTTPTATPVGATPSTSAPTTPAPTGGTTPTATPVGATPSTSAPTTPAAPTSTTPAVGPSGDSTPSGGTTAERPAQASGRSAPTGAAVATGPGERLPRTGADVAPLLATAGVLVGAGLTALRLARRRTPQGG